jgi:hypothetical protein
MVLPLLAAGACFFLLSSPGAAGAASSSAALDISLEIRSSAALTLGTTSISFLGDDPELFPSLAARENPVPVLAKTRTKGTPTLTVLAADDLRDSDQVIPATALSWAADGDPFIGGTMSRTAPQPAAAFPGGSGSYLSAFRYYLANSPGYLPGNYSTTLTYILTAP